MRPLPSQSIKDILIGLHDVAAAHNSYAYQFGYAKDHLPEARGYGCDLTGADLVEIRVTAERQELLTPCDQAGRHIDAPKPLGDAQPFHIGRGVQTPRFSFREELKDAVRPEVRAEIEAEQPKKRRWFRKG